MSMLKESLLSNNYSSFIFNKAHMNNLMKMGAGSNTST